MIDRSHALITTAGTDRPGIVQAIAEWILEQGGNIEDSRMAQLGGEFATIILVSGGSDIARKLESTRGTLEGHRDLTVIVREVSGRAQPSDKPVLRYRLSATALDHAGIVHRVARVLSERGVNIVSATTGTASAPFSGAPVFHLQMEVDIPSSLPVARLRDELARVGEEQNIDVTLEAR